MIKHQCPRCGRLLPTGEKCTCGSVRYKDYNKFKRDSHIRLFRQSPEWKALREAIIERDNGIDVYRYYHDGITMPGFSVHHIYGLSEIWGRRLDPLNLITLSDDTHASIEYRYKHGEKEALQKELTAMVAEQLHGVGVRGGVYPGGLGKS